MRLQFGTALALAATTLEAAEPLLGTKQDAISRPISGVSATSGFYPLLQMLMAIAVVAFLLKVAVPRLAGKFNKRLSPVDGSGIAVREAATLATGTLYVVEVRGKALLLSVSAQGVSCLADLTPAVESPASEPAFFDLLDQETARTAPEPREKAPVEEALERLCQLTSR